MYKKKSNIFSFSVLGAYVCMLYACLMLFTLRSSYLLQPYKIYSVYKLKRMRPGFLSVSILSVHCDELTAALIMCRVLNLRKKM